MRPLTPEFMNFIRLYEAWRNRFVYDFSVEDSEEFSAYFKALPDEKFLEYWEAFTDYASVVHSDDAPYFVDNFEDYISGAKLSYDELYNEIIRIDPGLYSLVEYARKIPVKMNDMSRIVFDTAHGYLSDMSAVYDACMLKVFRIALAHHKMLNVNLADAIQSGFLGIESAVQEVKWHIHYFYDSERQRILLAINRCIEREIWWNNRYSDRGIYLHYYDDLIKVIKYASHHPEFYTHCNDVEYLKSISKKIPIPMDRLVEMCKGHRYETADINTVEDEDSVLAFEEIENKYENELLREREEYVLSSLTPRESAVIRYRFGFDDGKPRTLEEAGREFDLTRERIRQIESKGLRKLRHPSRARILRSGVWVRCNECGAKYMTAAQGSLPRKLLCDDCWDYYNAIENAENNGFEILAKDKANKTLELAHECGFEFDYNYGGYTHLVCGRCEAQNRGYSIIGESREEHTLTLKCSCGNVFSYDYTDAFTVPACDECLDWLDDEEDLFDDVDLDDDI